MQATTTQQPAAQALGTLAKGYVPKYLIWATEDQQSADLLKQLFHKRKKPGPERDAVLDGYCALHAKTERYVESLRDRGGLLFFGQAPALAAAREAEATGA